MKENLGELKFVCMEFELEIATTSRERLQPPQGWVTSNSPVLTLSWNWQLQLRKDYSNIAPYRTFDTGIERLIPVSNVRYRYRTFDTGIERWILAAELGVIANAKLGVQANTIVVVAIVVVSWHANNARPQYTSNRSDVSPSLSNGVSC